LVRVLQALIDLAELERLEPTVLVEVKSPLNEIIKAVKEFGETVVDVGAGVCGGASDRWCLQQSSVAIPL